MKKILAVSALALLLAACSNQNDRPEPPHNAQLEQAMQECHASTVQAGAAKKGAAPAKPGKAEEAKFEACMKEKGFEKPADNGQGPKGPAPAQSTGGTK